VIYRLLLVSALMLAGCSAPVARPVPEDVSAAWKQRQLGLTEIHSWRLRARVALQAGETGGQADLLWNQSASSNDLRLVGAWGRGFVRLQFSDGRATLIDDHGVPHQGTDAGDLLYNVTGWIIPISSLHAWIVGLPVDASSARTVELDAYGRLKTLEENGWHIDYDEYAVYDQRELPRRMVLSQTRTVNGDARINVRLVVTGWQVDPA
jgi:outer membrane lipoprotein LolB